VAHSHWSGVRRFRDIHIQLAYWWHSWHCPCFKHRILETTKQGQNILHLFCWQMSELSSDLRRDTVKLTLRIRRQPWNVSVKKVQFFGILRQFFAHVTKAEDGRESALNLSPVSELERNKE